MSHKPDYLQRGLAYIERQQQTNGSFLADEYVGESLEAAAKLPTIFLTCLLAGMLESVQSPNSSVRQKLYVYLTDQEHEDGTFNYWDRFSDFYKQRIYPNDLDDTSCALLAMHGIRPESLDALKLAGYAHALIACETVTGGPYRTWVVSATSAEKWRDVDVVVNANISRCLGRVGVQLPAVMSLIERTIHDKNLVSTYYPDDLIVAYFLAQTDLSEASRQLLRQLVLRMYGIYDENNTDLRDALAVSTLLRLGHPSAQLVPVRQRLFERQASEGCWQGAGFWLDRRVDNCTYMAGSAALTTGACLEALCMLDAAEQPKVDAVLSPHERPDEYIGVEQALRRSISELPRIGLRSKMDGLLNRIIAIDRDYQIVMMPWLLVQSSGQMISHAVCSQLAQASLWGWMAYTAQDDMLDDQVVPILLPATNIAMRQVLLLTRAALPGVDDFHEEVSKILARVDAANDWELSHCRMAVSSQQLRIEQLPVYGNYWQLADRSLGHMIAGLGVLYAQGVTKSSRTMKSYRQFFRQYVIARQLCDDLHDWQDDLQQGHINAVAADALQRFAGHREQVVLDLATDLAPLRQLVWEIVVPNICADIQSSIQRARQELQLFAVVDPAPLERLLAPLDIAADQALLGRRESLAFIKAF